MQFRRRLPSTPIFFHHASTYPPFVPVLSLVVIIAGPQRRNHREFPRGAARGRIAVPPRRNHRRRNHRGRIASFPQRGALDHLGFRRGGERARDVQAAVATAAAAQAGACRGSGGGRRWPWGKCGSGGRVAHRGEGWSGSGSRWREARGLRGQHGSAGCIVRPPTASAAPSRKCSRLPGPPPPSPRPSSTAQPGRLCFHSSSCAQKQIRMQNFNPFFSDP